MNKNISVVADQPPVRLGLLGLNFGEGMAKQISKESDFLKLEAVCDLDGEKSRRVAADYNVKSYEQLEAMLENPEIEAIGLFTGPVGRAKLISRIIQANRHVLTTKPFEIDAVESKRVLEEAKERGLIVQLNSPGPCPAQDIVSIRSLVREHNLGMPVAFRAETWSRYREKPNGTWYDDPEKCPVAPILRLGIYFLNDFAPLLGVPKEVFVMQSKLFTERPTSDHGQISIAYENGSLGFVFASFCIDDGQPFRDHITINYEGGTLRRWIERKNPWADLSADVAVVELQKKGMAPVRLETSPGSFAGWYQWSAFWQAVRRGSPMDSRDVDNIQFGVNLLEAMRLSASSGKPMPVRRLH